MKFGIYKKDIQAPLEKLSRLIPRRTTLPILHCVKMDFNGSYLTLTAGSIETTMTIKVNATPIDGETGVVCVDLKQFLGTIKKMPNVGIRLEVEGNTMTINFDTGKINLPLLPAEKYPAAPKVNGGKLNVDSEVMSKVEKAFNFTSDSDLRPALCGVYFDTVNGNIVGTNGHTMYTSSGLSKDSGVEPFILTEEAYAGIKGLEVSTIMVGEAHALIEGENFYITARLIDGNFPNYKSVIPKNDIKYISNLEALRTSVDRALLCTDEFTSLVVFEFNDAIYVKTRDEEAGTSFKEKVECNGEHKDEVGLNGKYLLSCLNALDSKDVIITFTDNNRPLTIHPMSEDLEENELILLMPMMI